MENPHCCQQKRTLGPSWFGQQLTVILLTCVLCSKVVGGLIVTHSRGTGNRHLLVVWLSGHWLKPKSRWENTPWKPISPTSAQSQRSSLDKSKASAGWQPSMPTRAFLYKATAPSTLSRPVERSKRRTAYSVVSSSRPRNQQI